MDGVFMRKGIRNAIICLLVVCSLWIGMLAADRNLLNEELIRLHVVANSDSVEDQDIKLQVKDAVVEYLLEALADVSDVEHVRTYVRQDLLPLYMWKDTRYTGNFKCTDYEKEYGQKRVSEDCRMCNSSCRQHRNDSQLRGIFRQREWYRRSRTAR